MSLSMRTSAYHRACAVKSKRNVRKSEGKGVRAKEMLRRCVKAERDPDTGSEKPRGITRYILAVV